MVTLTIPKNSDVSLYSSRISHEIATATNIKSRVNRKNVLSALGNIKEALKKIQGNIENGLIIFSTSDMIEIVKPKIPINKSDYICGSKFDLSLLESFLDEEEVFHYVIIDGKGFLVAKVTQSNEISQTEIIDRKQSFVRNRHNNGGQSAPRFGRLRDNDEKQYIKNCVEIFRKCPFENWVIAGKANIKRQFVDQFKKYYEYRDPIDVLDISQGSDKGLQEAIDSSQDTIKNFKKNQEKMEIKEFTDTMENNSDLCVFGSKETKEYLENGILEKIFVDKIFYKKDREFWDKLTNMYGTTMVLVENGLDMYGNVVGIKRFVVEL